MCRGLSLVKKCVCVCENSIQALWTAGHAYTVHTHDTCHSLLATVCNRVEVLTIYTCQLCVHNMHMQNGTTALYIICMQVYTVTHTKNTYTRMQAPTHARTRTHTYTHTHIRMYIHMYLGSLYCMHAMYLHNYVYILFLNIASSLA